MWQKVTSSPVADEEEDLQQLAVAAFRALLRVLPASTRTWFGSLRDRSTASLVEVSPLLGPIESITFMESSISMPSGARLRMPLVDCMRG